MSFSRVPKTGWCTIYFKHCAKAYSRRKKEDESRILLGEVRFSTLEVFFILISPVALSVRLPKAPIFLTPHSSKQMKSVYIDIDGARLFVIVQQYKVWTILLFSQTLFEWPKTDLTRTIISTYAATFIGLKCFKS